MLCAPLAAIGFYAVQGRPLQHFSLPSSIQFNSSRAAAGGALAYCLMNLRSLLVSLSLLPLAAMAADAQTPRRIIAGKSPAFLFADAANAQVYMVTAGTDLNFNGVMEPDSGDLAPQWYRIDAATETIMDSMSFDSFFSSFPVRLGVDLKGKRLYASQMGRVRSYDITTMTLAQDTVVTGSFAAVSFDETSNRLLLAERVGFTDPGYLHVVDPATGVTTAVVRTGVNPSMSGAHSGGNGRSNYYTLNEGAFGANNAGMSYTALNMGVFDSVDGQPLGGGASYLISQGDNAFAVLRGGNKIFAFNTRIHQPLPYSPIVLGPARVNTGPYTMAFQGDSVLLVGMHAGKLLKMRISDGVITDSIGVRGRVESIAVRDSLAFVASRAGVEAGSDSVITVVNLNSDAAIDTISIGMEPGKVFVAADGNLHVIGSNPGGTAYMWKVYNGTTLAQIGTTATFSGAIASPFRVYYDRTNDTLYLVASDSLRAHPVSSPSAAPTFIYGDTSDSTLLGGVSDGGDYLLLTQTGPAADPGAEYLQVVSKGGTLVAKFQTGPRPLVAARVRSRRDDVMAFYVLDQGAPGRMQSQIDHYEFQPNILGADTLGDGANHLLMGDDDAALVTLNGSHEVVGLNLDDWKVAGRFSTGTSGFDGPRETMIYRDSFLVVSTYAGDIRMFSSPTQYKSFAVGGKAEGITGVGDKVFVASIFAPDYSPDSAVVVFDPSVFLASVERVDNVASAVSLEQNYPNPAAAGTTIRFTVDAPAHVVLSVYTADGRMVKTLIDEPMESGSYSAELLTGGLPSGSYIYTLQAGSARISKAMQVVR